MAEDVQANIGLKVDTSQALAGLKALQSEISALHVSLAKMGPSARAGAAGAQRALIDNINATGRFAASMTTVKTTAESFTTALEKNKLTMGEYFRYAGGASKSFGKNFAREFATIEKVAVERVKTLQTQYIKLGRDASGAMKAIAVRPLALDMNNLQTKTAIAAQKQQILNQLLKQGSTQMLNWGKNTQWAGRQLMVGFSIPLALFASKAMRAFSDMEKQIVSFKRVYGDLSTSAKETDAMAESVKRLASEFTQYGIAVKDTIDMASKAAAMGKQGADLLAQVQQSSRLAALGQVDQQKALQTTITLTNAFGTASKDLGGKINFLNAVENQTVLSIEDMTTAIPKAGPVVKQLGGDVEDLAFFLTAMKEGGINASEGANALKSGLASIINPTKKASDMLRGFGIDLNGIVKKDKGNVRQTVVDFAKALDKLDPLNRAKAIEQLFGKFQFARISTLMKNVASDSSQAAITAQLAQKSSIELAVIAARELRKVSSSPLFKFQKAIQDFQTQLAPIGETFMKVLTPVIEWVNGMLKAFNGLGDGTKTFIVGFTSVVAGLGPILLMTFGLIANGFANLIKGFAAVKSMFNRVQTSSEVLGQETHYLTEEQMKAKAVAASLDQVHGKLVQTFNVEAESVNMLAAAYERAVVASQSLMPGVGKAGRTRGVKKFATGGIIKGPGTGTSDSIIARVSNNEAIIPAKSVQQYPHLVNALIQGKVPGFRKGREGDSMSAALKRARLTEAGSVISTQTRGMTWDTKEAEQRAIRKAVNPLFKKGLISQDQVNNLLHTDASHINKDVIKTSLGDVKRWRAANLVADSSSVNRYLQGLSARTGKKYASGSYLGDLNPKEIAKISGVSVAAAQKEIAALQAGSHPVTRQSAKVLSAIASLEKPTTGTGILGIGARAALGERLKGNFYETMGSRKYDPSKDAQIQKDVERRIKKAEQDYKTRKAASDNTQAKKSSAEKATAKAETQIAKTAEQRAKDAKRETLAARRAAVREAVAKRKSGATLDRKEKALLKKYDEEMKARAEKSAITKKANAEAAAAAEQERVAREQAKSQARSEAASRGWDTRRANQEAAARKIPMREKITNALGMNEKSRAGRRAAAAKFSGGKMMGAGMALSIAGSAAGAAIGGDLGNNIMMGANIAGSVAMVASAFPALAEGIALFLPEIAIAAAAFGGLYLIVDQVTKAERERSKKLKGIAEATAMTEQKKKSLGDFFGKTVTGSYFSSVNATGDKSMSNVQEQAISELRKNSQFKQDYKSTIETMQNASKKELEMMLGSISLGLAKDFSKDEIAVIIKALQEEAGVTSVNLDFAAIDVTSKTGFANSRQVIQDSFDVLKSESKKTSVYGGDIVPMNSDVKSFGLFGPTQSAGNLKDVSGVPKWLSDWKIYSRPEYTKSNEYAVRKNAVDIAQTNYNNAVQGNDKEKQKTTKEELTNQKRLMDDFIKANPDYISALDNATNGVSNYYDALKSAYQSGDIKKPKFIEGLSQIMDLIKSSGQRSTIVDSLISKLGSAPAKKAVSGIKDLSLQLKAIFALSSGNNPDKVMEIIGKIISIQDMPISPDKTKLINEYATALEKLMGTKTPSGLQPDPNTDPYNLQKDTLTKLQQARQKKWQDAMSLINLQEEEINKKYETRVAALDRVNELNQSIAASQKDQLDLADALSRGDIAAAARAAQTMRSNDTQRSYEDQKRALENAQANEISALTVLINGKYYTKDQIQGKLNYYERTSLTNAIKNNKATFATGGMVRHYEPGGGVRGPGTGTSDDIPAMLSNGEYVIRAKAAQAIGTATLDKLNHAEKFAKGGYVRGFDGGGTATNSDYDKYGRHRRLWRGDETPGMLYSPGGIGYIKNMADNDWLANIIKLHPAFWIPEIGHILSGGDKWIDQYSKPSNDELKFKDNAKLGGFRLSEHIEKLKSVIKPAAPSEFGNKHAVFPKEVKPVKPAPNPYLGYKNPPAGTSNGAIVPNLAKPNSPNLVKPKKSKGTFMGLANGGTVQKLAGGGIPRNAILADAAEERRNNRLKGLDLRNFKKSLKTKAPDLLSDVKKNNLSWFGSELDPAVLLRTFVGFASGFNEPAADDDPIYNLGKTAKDYRAAFKPILSVANDIALANQPYTTAGYGSLNTKLKFIDSKGDSYGAGAFYTKGSYPEGSLFSNNDGKISINLGNMNSTMAPFQMLSHEVGHALDSKLLRELPSSWNSEDSSIVDIMRNQRDRAKNYASAHGIKSVSGSLPSDRTSDSIYEEYRAQIWSGIIARLSGQKIDINKNFVGNYKKDKYNIWQNASVENGGKEDSANHPGSKTSGMLQYIGYAHPEESLKYFGLTLPEKYKKYKLGGYKSVPNLYDYDIPAYRANGGLIGKFADGGKVAPRNALLADAAERTFKKPKTNKNTGLTISSNSATRLMAGDPGGAIGDAFSYAMDDIYNNTIGPFMNSFVRHGDVTKPGTNDALAAMNLIPFGKVGKIGKIGNVAEAIKPSSNFIKDFFRSKVVNLVTGKINPSAIEDLGYAFRSNQYGRSVNLRFQDPKHPYFDAGAAPDLGHIAWDSLTGEIKMIHIDEMLRGKGLGKSLFAKAMAHALENGVALPSRSSDITRFGAGLTNSLEKTLLPGLSNFKKIIGFDAKATIPDLGTIGTPTTYTRDMERSLAKQQIIDFASGRAPLSTYALALAGLGAGGLGGLIALTFLKGKNKNKTSDKNVSADIKELMKKPKMENLGSLGNVGTSKHNDNLAPMGSLSKSFFGFANGGMVSKIKPSYFAAGDLARGTDVIPAMLTPGEFIMTRSAVQNFGVDNLRAINAGVATPETSMGESVYNYSINVNVSSNSDANEIAKTVMTQIKRIDSQRVRGVTRG